jgi:hypothetical protein
MVLVLAGGSFMAAASELEPGVFVEGDTLAPQPDSAPAQAAPPPTGSLPLTIADAAIAARNLPLGERMAAVSQRMLDHPYLVDPLGEGTGSDGDPLARYDVYDCLTFVEEVLALSWAGDPVHAAEVRLRLRYGDHPATYANRRHFMELQWLPGNVADGWLVDTTQRYGTTVRQERQVTSAMWTAWRRRGLFGLSDAELPLGTMRLDVLPLDVALASS